MRTEADFTSGPIVGPLLRFSLPILLALFLQALYGAVDLLIVGKYAAAADVSGVVMFYAAFFHGDLLCAVFARDREIIRAGFDYLRAYAIDCLFTCFLFCFIGFYNGLGRTAFVMAQGIGAAFLIRIPVAYLMSVRTGRLFYIGLGVPCSTIAQITVCFLFLAHIKRRGLMAGLPDDRE